jgi:predicted restriction endonuclease
MVEGCDYSTCYDIHRVIPGRDGGQYVIGNMFAICPNHHAEVERKIIRLDRQTDARLTVAVLKTAEGS